MKPKEFYQRMDFSRGYITSIPRKIPSELLYSWQYVGNAKAFDDNLPIQLIMDKSPEKYARFREMPAPKTGILFYLTDGCQIFYYDTHGNLLEDYALRRRRNKKVYIVDNI